MKKLRLQLFVFALVLMSTNKIFAHGRYVLPSHTNLSSDTTDTVTVDISISNDFFHPDMSYGGEVVVANEDPMVQMTAANSQFTIVNPNGRVETHHRLLDFGRKSVGAVQMDKSGTYKIAIVQQPTYMTLFLTADGTQMRFPGKYKEVADKLPEGANNIRTLEVTGRAETYVTRNALNRAAMKPTGIGVELAGGSHPNDLFVGETARFEFFLNGKPAPKGMKVAITRGNTRYRNNRDTLETQTDENGAISVDWPASGFYLLEIDSLAKPTSVDADFGSTSLYITFDVHPE